MALLRDMAKAILTTITGSFDSYSSTSLKLFSNYLNLHKFSTIMANVCRWMNFSLTPNPFTDSIAIYSYISIDFKLYITKYICFAA